MMKLFDHKIFLIVFISGNIALLAQETSVVPPAPTQTNTKRAQLIRKKAFRKTSSESTTAAPIPPSSNGSEDLEESSDVIVPPVPEQ
jgi:hypothetical protein